MRRLCGGMLTGLGVLLAACQTSSSPASRPASPLRPNLEAADHEAVDQAWAETPATSAVATASAAPAEPPPPAVASSGGTSGRVACTLRPAGRRQALAGCGATHEEACRAALAGVDDLDRLEITMVDGLPSRQLHEALFTKDWSPKGSAQRASCRVEVDLRAKGVSAKGYGADRDEAKRAAHRNACRKLPGRCGPGVTSEAIFCGEATEKDEPGAHWCLVGLPGRRLGQRDVTHTSEQGWAHACRAAFQEAGEGAPAAEVRRIDGIPYGSLDTKLYLAALNSGAGAPPAGVLDDMGTLGDPPPCR